MRLFLLAFSALGALCFGTLFIVSLVAPRWVESTARELIRAEVQARVQARIEGVDDARLKGMAEQARVRQQAELDRLRGLHAFVENRVQVLSAELGGYPCGCEAQAARVAREVLVDRIKRSSTIVARLDGWIRNAYRDTADKLIREVRIFSGANLLAFALLGVLAWRHRGTALQLLLPALVLLGAAAVTAWFYLFGQDWLRTLVFADYVGYGYFAYLGLAGAFLGDIAMNRARVTSRLLASVSSGPPGC
jgi:hypothetical protein